MNPNRNLEKLSEYSQRQLDRALKSAVLDLTEDLSPAQSPRALLLGGQPGAGKSTLHNIIKADMPNCVVINGDEFRIYHPHFGEIDTAFGADGSKYTQKFASAMTEGLIERLSDKGYNLIVEGTLRTTDAPQRTCELLKSKGYTVELSVMAVDKAVSWQGTINRYEAMKREGKVPRATPKEHHDLVVSQIPRNIGKLYDLNIFDRISMYDRTGACLYDSKVHDFNPLNLMKYIVNGEKYEVDSKTHRPYSPIEVRVKKAREQSAVKAAERAELKKQGLLPDKPKKGKRKDTKL